MPKDRKTKYQSIYVRHQESCALESDGRRCNCSPRYFGKGTVLGERVTTGRKNDLEAARAAYVDEVRRIGSGGTSHLGRGGITLTQARERFCIAARDGRALNKNGRPYKPTAVYDIEISLKTHAEPTLGTRPLVTIRPGDVQALVNGLQHRRSGSRVRSVVNGLRSLYAWAQLIELVPFEYDPARRVRLPALDTRPVERIVGPAEFAGLLAALPVADAIPYALAAYAMARAQQIRYLRWLHVQIDPGVLSLAVEEAAAKTAAARRDLPAAPPLLALLRRAYLEAGRPDGDQLVVPPRYQRGSGLFSTNGLAKRAKRRWVAAGLEPITLHEARHSGSSWLAGAGVHPKLHSYFMGHRTTSGDLGGGSALTQNVYTHVLWDDVLRAAEQFSAYVAADQRKAAL